MPAVQLEHVGFTTAGCSILEEICWSVPSGACAAILGPNGSGKSTILRLLTGYLFPTVDSAAVLGHRLGAVDVHQLRREVGVVDPGSPFLVDVRLSVLEVVLTGFFGNLCLDFDQPNREQIELARIALAEVGLAGHANQRFQTLSTGESRRVLLARALVHKPKLLILDEPTAGLDLLGRETMLATIDRLLDRAPNLTLLIVTHHLEELSPRTTDVLLLRQGKVHAAGSPEEVLTTQSLSDVFGCPVRITRENSRWQWAVEPAIWTTLLSTASEREAP